MSLSGKQVESVFTMEITWEGVPDLGAQDSSSGTEDRRQTREKALLT